MKKQQVKKTVNTVPCPIHGTPLELKEQDGKLVAVCRCDVKPNKHAGQIVYEQLAKEN